MEIFLVFFLISTPVLGILCLVVLEYQNGKARKWARLWSAYDPGPPPHPTAIPAAKDPAPQPPDSHRARAATVS